MVVALRALLSALPLAIVACSVFPNADRPPSVVESMQVEYAFTADSPRTIQVPASCDELTVLDLAVEPSPRGERFERGHRILLLPVDCQHARLHCRVLRWSGNEPRAMRARQTDLFPGAHSVRFLDEPTP
jgi:hypothetical protein